MQYCLLFSGLAILQAYIAFDRGGAAWILLWSSLSCLLAGIAYGTKKAGIFGKNKKGSLRPLPLIVLLPYLVPTWGFWHLYRLMVKEDCANEIIPGLWLGRRPFVKELPDGTGMVIDMTAEFPVAKKIQETTPYYCFPTLDGTAPDDDVFTKVVELAASSPCTAYIHCAMGHGRSAAVVAGVLIAKGYAQTVEEALALIKKKRPLARLKAVQYTMVKRLEGSLRRQTFRS